MEKIIIDCDPGVDDALAILLALASPEIELLGVTTVAGNLDLEKVHSNARDILALASGQDIPLARGCDRPLIARRGSKTNVHGNDGLAGIKLQRSKIKDYDGHAVDFIIDTVMSNPGEVTLCPIAPLTNIAVAMIKEPRLRDNVKDIVLMGGAAFCSGNVTPYAEFNFFVDPHAAHIVFNNAVHVTMLGLDVTSKADIRTGLCETLEQGGFVAKTAAAMSRGYAKFDQYLHDPCVIAYLICPEIFSGVHAQINIEFELQALIGLTLVRVHSEKNEDKSKKYNKDRCVNSTIITDVNSNKLMSLIADRIKSIS